MNKFVDVIINSCSFDSYKISDFDTGIVTFLNPYSYMIARKRTRLFSQFDFILCDGLVLVLMLRLFGFKAVRASFDMTSIAPIVLKDAESKLKKVYFIGSKENEISCFVSKMLSLYPQLCIFGSRCGYFNSSSDREGCIKYIVENEVELVVVGMGCPIQDQFLVDLVDAGWSGSGFSCGGFFHQTSSSTATHYYPYYINKFNLRWLYRMYDEPKLIKRYFMFYPVFVFVFVFDVLRYKLYE